MIRIGLAGVPGSGKSELAAALAERLPNVAVVDDYVPKIERRVKLALGFHATYIGNLHVALDRAALERSIPKKSEYLVTCGTIYDTASYSAVAFEKEQQFVVTEAEQQDLVRRVDASMRTLACLFMDAYVYDLLFYLPVQDGDESVANLDRNLRAAATSFDKLGVIDLDGPKDIAKCIGVVRDLERALQEQETAAQGAV